MKHIKILFITLFACLMLVLSSCNGTKDSSSTSTSSTTQSSSSKQSSTQKSSSTTNSSTSSSTSTTSSTVKNVTVTFISISKDANIVVTGKPGESIAKLANPTPLSPENKFVGWYTDRDAKTKFDFVFPSFDTKIYAVWTSVNKAILTFDNADIAATFVDFGGKITLEQDITKAGFVFGGYYTDKDFTNKFTNDTVVNEDMTIYCKWDKDLSSYNYVTYMLSTGSKVVDYYAKDASYTLRTNFGAEFNYELYLDSNYSNLYNQEALTNDFTLYVNLWTKSLTLDNDTVLTNDGMTKTTVVYVPEVVNGVKITKIADKAFYANKNIEEVVLPSTIKNIGDSAFAYDTYLKDINLPDGIESIGLSAFLDCKALVSVGSLGTASVIKTYTFSGCTSLENFVDLVNIKTVGAYAFSNCKSLTKLLLPNVESFGDYAISDCSNLEDLSLSATLSEIPAGLLSNTANLVNIELNGNENFSINNGLLIDSSNEVYYILGTIDSLNLADYTFADGVFAGANIKNVVVLSKEGNFGVLKGLKYIESISVDSLDAQSIGYYFGLTSPKDNGIKGMLIPNSLSKVEFKTAPTDIPAYAFYGISGLNTLGDMSFDSIGEYAFAGTSVGSISLSKDFANLNTLSFLNDNVLSISVDPNNTTYASADNAIYSKDMSILYYCASGKTEYVIPASVHKIAENAFVSSSIASLDIPNTVTSLAFASLANMDSIHELSAPYIGDNAGNNFFMYPFGSDKNNNGLTNEAAIPSTLTKFSVTENIKSVDDEAFMYCENLTEIILPNSIESIGQYSFALTNIVDFTLPNSCKTISPSAFAYCFSLVNFTTNEGLESLSENMLARCPFLETVTIKEGPTAIPANFIEPYSEKSDNGTTQYLSSINKIVLPSSIESIGESAFTYLSWWGDEFKDDIIFEISNLENSKLKTIAASAFENSGLQYAILPNTLTSIGANAFAGSTRFNECLIGSNGQSALSYIGASAFENTDLSILVINKSVENATGITVGTNAFNNVGRLTVYVPDNSVSVYNNDPTFKNYNIDSVNNYEVK